jgi:hypothetical protein
VVSSFRLLPATTTTARSSPAAAAAATGGSGGVDAPTPPSIDESMLAVGEDGSGGPTTTGTTSLLTPATIAELIEVSFVQSCLQLSKGYVDVLKLFVAAVKAGYDLSVPLDDLVRLVGDSPVRSAGRELVVEEVGLRDEWMGVVYGLLDALGGDVVVDGDGGGGGRKECGDADDDDDDDPSRAAAHGRISNAVRAALSVRIELRDEEARSGGESDSSVALSNLTVERALASISRAGGGGGGVVASDDVVARAFLTNDVRVALVALRVLEEEGICSSDSAGRRSTTTGGGGGGERMPRPSIPGT